MIPIGELHAAFERFSSASNEKQYSGLSLPELAVAHVSVGPPLKPSARLGAACGKDGWIRFQSDLEWTNTLDETTIADLGGVIAGEWAEGPTSSWRILPGDDGPVIRQFAESEDGEPYLRQSEWVIRRQFPNGLSGTHERGAMFLEYAIYWDIGPDGRARRAFDRFVGFADTREGNG